MLVVAGAVVGQDRERVSLGLDMDSAANDESRFPGCVDTGDDGRAVDE
ncbi:hypothetical protein [Agrobacterium radiobacter]